MQKWYNFIANSSKANYYRSFKINFTIEKYLSLPTYLRFGLSRLRCSSHQLKIETGRWTRPPIPPANRICSNCDLHLVEDEYHFILICPKYSNIRINYIDQRFWQTPTLYKFERLMSGKYYYNIAQFILKANGIRSS